jgi:rhodanese-related sulfurtransferase
MLARMNTPTAAADRRTPHRHQLFPSARNAAIAAALAASLGCATTTSDKSLRPIETDRLAQMTTDSGGKTLLIDVRTPEEFRMGTIPGAVNRNLADIRMTTNPKQFEAYDRVVVFGRNPASTRGRAIAKRLIRIGVDDVFFYEAGWEGWQRTQDATPGVPAP